jgi:hypothetical protein
MKAILIIALLALTAIAAPSGISEFHKGFAAKLALTADQNKEAEACANSLQIFALKYYPGVLNPKFRSGASLYEFIEESDAKKSAFFKQIETDAMTILMPTCGAYVGNLLVHLQNGIKDKQEATWSFQQRAIVNVHRHSAEIISKVTQMVDQLKEQKNHAAGETLGHIVQVLSGNVVPAQVHNPNLRVNVPTPNAVEITEFINAFLEHVGIKHKVTLKEIETLGADIKEFQKQMQQLQKEINNPKSLTDAIVALTKYPQVIINTGKKVHDQLVHWFPNVQFHYDAQTMAKAVPHVIHNIALNLPAIEMHSDKFVEALNAKKAAEAGRHLADIVNEIKK